MPGHDDSLEALEQRVRTILPEQYQDSYDTVQPVSMGSAGLKYDRGGGVAWDEMWGSFCDLAMAGGPPHKGKLLEPGRAADVAASPDLYEAVTDELCRGITMVTDLPARPSPTPGWVRVGCFSDGTTGWLLRAVVMENVSVHADGVFLDVPAAPGFRLEKEIKNVITVLAKTCHYWLGHVPPVHRRQIGELFAAMAPRWPLVVPVLSPNGMRTDDDEARAARMTDAIREQIGLAPSAHGYAGWVGVQCPDVRSAIWMMRALVATNVLARRENTTLFVPIGNGEDDDVQVIDRLVRVHGFAATRGLLGT